MKVYAGTKTQIKQAFKFFKDVSKVGIDTEGSGLDCHRAKLWSVQFGTEEHQVLIPLYDRKGQHTYMGEFEDLLADDNVIKIAHNAAYDVKMLWARGYDPQGIYDTLVMEQILNAGLFNDNSLSGVLRRRLGVHMSKAERNDFYKDEDGRECDARGTISIFEAGGFEWTPELINYALGDVEYLVPLHDIQQKELRKNQLLKLANHIELPLVPVTAVIEYRGVELDKERCQLFQDKMIARAEEAKKELITELDQHYQAYAVPIYKAAKKKYDAWKAEYDLVKIETNKMRVKNTDGKRGTRLSEEAKAARQEIKDRAPAKSAPKEPKEINLNSTFQVRSAFAEAGADLPNLRKEVLQDSVNEHPLIALFVEYRKYEKLRQMSEIIEKISPITGRVHGHLNQNVETGRYSSTDPNLQNIPSKGDEGKEFRSLFKAGKGNKMIIADYSAIELVIIAIRSGDKNLLHALDAGLDLHCFTMSKALECSYDALVNVREKKATKEDKAHIMAARIAFELRFSFPDLALLDDLTKWVDGLRSHFKNLTYGVAYGIAKFGLARRFHCDLDTAQDFIDLFFRVYPTIKRWLESLSRFAEKNGYSLTVAGRRRFYRHVHRPTSDEVTEGVKQYLKNHYKGEGHETPVVDRDEYNEIWRKVEARLYKEYKASVGRIRRQGANAPIQGQSADTTKDAMVSFDGWWWGFCQEKKINYYKYGIVLTVHDELVVVVPEQYVEEVLLELKTRMENSAKRFLGRNAKIEVTPKVADHWVK